MAQRHAEKEMVRGLTTLINEVIPEDQDYVSSPPIPDPQLAIDAMCNLYVRYVTVANQLTSAHNEMIHKQNREVLLVIIEHIFGRILELKQQLVEIEHTDYLYMDPAIEQNNITRSDLEIKVPKYYYESRLDKLTDINERVNHIYKQIEMVRTKDKVDITVPRRKRYIIDEKTGELVIEEVVKPVDPTPPEVKKIKALKKLLRNILVSYENHRKRILKKISRPYYQGLDCIWENSRFKNSRQLLKLLQSNKMDLVIFNNPFKLFAWNKALLTIKRHERGRTKKVKFLRERECKKFIKNICLLKNTFYSNNFTKVQSTNTIKSYWKMYQEMILQQRDVINRGLLAGVFYESNQYKVLKYKLLKSDYRRNRVLNNIEKKIENIGDQMLVRLKRRAPIDASDFRTELICYMIKWCDTALEFIELDVLENPPLYPPLPDPDIKMPPPARKLGIPEGLPEDMVEKNYPLLKFNPTGMKPVILGGSALIRGHHYLSQKKIFDALLIIEKIKQMFERGLTKEEKEKMKQREKALKDAKKRKAQLEQEEKEKLEELKKQGYIPVATDILPKLINDARTYLRLYPSSMESKAEQFNRGDVKADAVFKYMMNLRMQVDKSMDGFKLALDQYVHRETEPKKKFKEKKKKGKKIPKPLTEKEKMHLIDTLAKEEYLRVFTPNLIENLPGTFNLHNYELRKYNFEDPEPYLKDIYQVVKEYCCLPLASEVARKHGEFVPSVLLLGPRYLTSNLIEAICTETGAVLIHLHPINSNRNLSAAKLVNLLAKAASNFAPTVIYIEQVHIAYYKKVPKNLVRDKPKYLSGIIPKLLKTITPENRVLLLASSDEPESANEKKMLSPFKKIITYPSFDYNTISSMWQSKIMKYHGVDRQFPYTQVAKRTLDYDLQMQGMILKKVMKTRRLLRLHHTPLTAIELLRAKPKFLEIAKRYWSWSTNAIPMYRDRTKMLEKAAEMRIKLAEEEAERERQRIKEEKKKERQIRAHRKAFNKQKSAAKALLEKRLAIQRKLQGLDKKGFLERKLALERKISPEKKRPPFVPRYDAQGKLIHEFRILGEVKVTGEFELISDDATSRELQLLTDLSTGVEYKPPEPEPKPEKKPPPSPPTAPPLKKTALGFRNKRLLKTVSDQKQKHNEISQSRRKSSDKKHLDNSNLLKGFIENKSAGSRKSIRKPKPRVIKTVATKLTGIKLLPEHKISIDKKVSVGRKSSTPAINNTNGNDDYNMPSGSKPVESIKNVFDVNKPQSSTVDQKEALDAKSSLAMILNAIASHSKAAAYLLADKGVDPKRWTRKRSVQFDLSQPKGEVPKHKPPPATGVKEFKSILKKTQSDLKELQQLNNLDKGINTPNTSLHIDSSASIETKRSKKIGKNSRDSLTIDMKPEKKLLKKKNSRTSKPNKK